MGFSRWLPADDIAEAYPEAFDRISPDGSSSEFTSIDNATGFAKDTETWINDQKMIRVDLINVADLPAAAQF